MADTLQPRSGLAASRVSERYRLEQVAGAGAMATVWRAYDKRLDRKVAIKVMSDALAADPASVARFVREARTAAAISHRNLVQVYDYSAAGDQPYLVMEYVDGGTLAAAIAAGPLQAGAVAELARDLLSALQCVHGAGVLHRDVKPANVLRGSDGRARLTDFGIAGLEDETRLTLARQVRRDAALPRSGGPRQRAAVAAQRPVRARRPAARDPGRR